METQETISAWAEETFGPAGSNLRVAARANEEMAELLRHLSSDPAHPKAPEEAADVVIYLDLLCARAGVDLGRAVAEALEHAEVLEHRRDDLPVSRPLRHVGEHVHESTPTGRFGRQDVAHPGAGLELGHGRPCYRAPLSRPREYR